MPRKKANPEPPDRNWGVLLEEWRAQMGAVTEGIQTLGQQITTRLDETDARNDRRFRDLETLMRETRADIRDLKSSVEQNSADIRQNSADIRQNSADIVQNSADIQAV